MRKPVYGISDQVLQKLGHTTTEDGWRVLELGSFVSSPARSAQSYCCHLGRPRLRFRCTFTCTSASHFRLKFFRSLYLLNM